MPSIWEVMITSAATPTMSAMVAMIQPRGAPLQMMIVAPVKKIMRPVPRSVTKISRSGTRRVPHSFA